jgi:hypothetical protein
MPNISKKTAYDVKEASDQSLSKGARKHYAENAQAGFKSDQGHGSFMSKHSQSRMGGSPLHQAEDEPKQTTIYPDRKNQKGQSQEDVFNLRNKQVNKAVTDYNEGSGTRNQFNDAVRTQKSTIDSLDRANKKMDTRFSYIDKQRSKLNKQQKDILAGKYK